MQAKFSSHFMSASLPKCTDLFQFLAAENLSLEERLSANDDSSVAKNEKLFVAIER